MNKLEKLLRKISRKERAMLDQLIVDLIACESNLNIVKLAGGGNVYRARKGRFRLIFHYDAKGELIIDSIKIRNEGTYRNL